MAASMPHRGPDGQSEFFEEASEVQVGLGHRRLSIIDLSHSADQPMLYEDLVIVFNGEVYNYKEIKEELTGKGHQFRTTSDTEVILHSWKEWGPDAIHKWHGMFSIVLYDRSRQELVAIRDRAGVKPFYYSFREGLFLFGSELKALAAHPAYKKELDPDAVGAFLQYGYVPAPYAIFNDTFKLRPGHLMRLNLKNRDLRTEQYWNVYDHYNKPKWNISLEDTVTETEQKLEKAFQYRMVADVPVGVFLSGGFDSTCVTALLQKNNMEKIRTFTIGSTDQQLNEAPFAQEIAARLGTDHTEYYCTSKEAIDIIPELPFYYDEPFADSSAIPTILVSRLARQKVTVALSADAGDEIFAGYNRYAYMSRYGRKLQGIPAPLRKMAAMWMEKISSDRIPILRNKTNFHSRYDKIKNLLNDPSPGELLKNLSIVFPEKELQRLFDPHSGINRLPTLHNSRELKDAFYDPLSFMMAVDFQTYMTDDILQKVDRAAMSASLEGRDPFLDQDVIEWAARLPADYKFHNGVKKYILREIVYKYIPKQMMDRPKMGFAVPVADWLQNELKYLVEEHLSEAAVKAHGLFEYTAVYKLKQAFYSGRKEKYLKIWHLLMFQMWYKRWGV